MIQFLLNLPIWQLLLISFALYMLILQYAVMLKEFFGNENPSEYIPRYFLMFIPFVFFYLAAVIDVVSEFREYMKEGKK